MKACSKCKLDKKGADFYKDKRTADGLYSNCKECQKGYKSSVNWRKRNPEKARLAKIEWSKKNRERESNYRTEWNEKNKGKVKAHAILNKAVRRGEIIKPDNCESCSKGLTGHQRQGHHEDYSKPYHVYWLCQHCHRGIHGKTLSKEAVKQLKKNYFYDRRIN